MRKPSAAAISRFLVEQSPFDFTYSAVGATATTPPTGYILDRTRSRLGEGADTYAAARAALQCWRQFGLGWLESHTSTPSIQVGALVGVLAHVAGLWWLNACRIVYVVDESGPLTRYGFAYGTLPAHAESGEERFLIEWDRSDDSVWYEILAFSRPRHILARLGYPMARRKQRQFARDSARAMIRAVHDERLQPHLAQ